MAQSIRIDPDLSSLRYRRRLSLRKYKLEIGLRVLNSEQYQENQLLDPSWYSPRGWCQKRIKGNASPVLEEMSLSSRSEVVDPWSRKGQLWPQP